MNVVNRRHEADDLAVIDSHRQVVARARQAGLRLSSKDIFLHQTIAELAATVTLIEAAAAPTRRQADGPVALGPIQQWFLETETGTPDHFTM